VIHTSPRWRTATIVSVIAIVALIVRDGNTRRAADATRPLASGGSAAAPAWDVSQPIRLASFNIHSAKGNDGVTDIGRVAEILHNADFAGLSEVRGGFRGVPANQAQQLGAALNCAWWYCPSEQRWWTDHFGTAAISRYPAQLVRIPLVNTRHKAYRNAVLARMELDAEHSVRIITTHLDGGDDQSAQLRTVIPLFLELEAPAVLMGDFNTKQAHELIQLLLKTPGVRSPLHDALPNGPPVETIDWIFTRGLTTVSAELVPNEASDHPAVRVEVRWEVPDAE
jgi:endonuclease/exonuclease/phosphatase family metal-dependent hydrolase